MTDKKFTLNQILSDDLEVIAHDMKKEYEKVPVKNGDKERAKLLRVQLQSFETILQMLKRIDQKLDNLEAKK